MVDLISALGQQDGSSIDRRPAGSTPEPAKNEARRDAPVSGNLDAEPARWERVVVKSGGRISFVKPGEIEWIEAQGDYVLFHSRGRKFLTRAKISDLENHLPTDRFIRIHRSTIVNIDRITEMQSLLNGEYAVILSDGTRVTLSRSFREKVFQHLRIAS